LETIINIDTNLFFFFNQKIANPLFDFIMPFLTNLDNWILPIVIFWVYLVFRGGKRGRTAALLLIPVIIGCDQISAQVIKPWVGAVVDSPSHLHMLQILQDLPRSFCFFILKNGTGWQALLFLLDFQGFMWANIIY